MSNGTTDKRRVPIVTNPYAKRRTLNSVPTTINTTNHQVSGLQSQIPLHLKNTKNTRHDEDYREANSNTSFKEKLLFPTTTTTSTTVINRSIPPNPYLRSKIPKLHDNNKIKKDDNEVKEVIITNKGKQTGTTHPPYHRQRLLPSSPTTRPLFQNFNSIPNNYCTQNNEPDKSSPIKNGVASNSNVEVQTPMPGSFESVRNQSPTIHRTVLNPYAKKTTAPRSVRNNYIRNDDATKSSLLLSCGNDGTLLKDNNDHNRGTTDKYTVTLLTSSEHGGNSEATRIVNERAIANPYAKAGSFTKDKTQIAETVSKTTWSSLNLQPQQRPSSARPESFHDNVIANLNFPGPPSSMQNLSQNIPVDFTNCTRKSDIPFKQKECQRDIGWEGSENGMDGKDVVSGRMHELEENKSVLVNDHTNLTDKVECKGGIYENLHVAYDKPDILPTTSTRINVNPYTKVASNLEGDTNTIEKATKATLSNSFPYGYVPPGKSLDGSFAGSKIQQQENVEDCPKIIIHPSKNSAQQKDSLLIRKKSEKNEDFKKPPTVSNSNEVDFSNTIILTTDENNTTNVKVPVNDTQIGSSQTHNNTSSNTGMNQSSSQRTIGNPYAKVASPNRYFSRIPENTEKEEYSFRYQSHHCDQVKKLDCAQIKKQQYSDQQSTKEPLLFSATQTEAPPDRRSSPVMLCLSNEKPIEYLSGCKKKVDREVTHGNDSVNRIEENNLSLFDPNEKDLLASKDAIQRDESITQSHHRMLQDPSINTNPAIVTNSCVNETKICNELRLNQIHMSQHQNRYQDRLKFIDQRLSESIDHDNSSKATNTQCSNKFIANNVESSSLTKQDRNSISEDFVASSPPLSPPSTKESARAPQRDIDEGNQSKVASVPDEGTFNNKMSTTSGNCGKQQLPSCAPKSSDLPTLPHDLIYDKERIQPIDDENRQRLIKEAELNATLKNGWKILPHQKAGILCSLLMRRIVLAFDMGLGKTLIGCVWAKAFKRTFPEMKIFIICPVSLKNEWRQTALDATGLHSEPEKRRKKGQQTKDDSDSSDICIFSWAKVPADAPNSVKSYVVIGDEAHNMQNIESARTKDMLKLTLSKRCKGVLLLTGTPMKNGKPANLFPLLRAIGHPFGDDKILYETYFCNGQPKRFGPGCGRLIWDASGSSNLDLLNAHISSHVLHKTKDDCLKELPRKTREYRNVPVSSRYELQHTNAMRKLANVVESMADNDSDSNEAVLGAFAHIRQVSSLAKIDATVALAKRILEKESSIVIFSFFVSIAKEVHKKLTDSGWSGELFTGETAPSKRHEMVENFQSGISPCFIATFGAGGVGVTLTAACTVILLDRPWTPGDALQAEDRVRRIGQTRPVKSIWMRAFQVDEQIDNLIEQKDQTANTVVDGRKRSNKLDKNKSSSAPKISLNQLIQSIVKNGNS